MAAYYRRRMTVLTCVCFIGMSLLVIFQELDRLDAHSPNKKSGARHIQSHSNRNNLYPAADSVVVSVVKGKHHEGGDGGEENKAWRAYSSVLSPPKVIEKGGDDDLIRRRPLKNDDRDRILNERLPSKPQFVVILAQMRTGSSIVGQILNQNRDFYYVYEPLHIMHDWETNGIPKFKMNPLMTLLLRNISQCEFSTDFVKSHGGWGGRTKSRAMMPLCHRRKICMAVSPLAYKQICLNFNGNIATKLIRANLLHLKPLIEENIVDVRVIHLVRDPRGQANSRLEYEALKKNADVIYSNESQIMPEPVTERERDSLPEDVLKGTQSFCSWVMATMKSSLSNPEWLRGRYKLVRYEDFAERPLRTAKEIYKFLGRGTPFEVLKWIEDNTQDKAEHDDPRHPLFSMSKNSSATASKWRLGLTMGEVMEVQDICSEAMSLLGYRPVGENTPLTDLSIPLVKPLNLQLP